MTEKRFHREEYPFDILGEFGLTEEMILGSSDISSDERKKIDKKKKTAELVVYFNKH